MRKIDNWNEVQEGGQFKELKAGAYVCKIIKVEDFADKEYIHVSFDINEGELKGYFADSAGRLGEWPYAGRDIRSYKQNALPYFKAFITAVEKSNDGYKWNWNEQSLVGQQVVAVFGEEEYNALDGTIQVSTRVQEWRSLVALREGKIKAPTIKKLKSDTYVAPAMTEVEEEDTPF